MPVPADWSCLKNKRVGNSHGVGSRLFRIVAGVEQAVGHLDDEHYLKKRPTTGALASILPRPSLRKMKPTKRQSSTVR